MVTEGDLEPFSVAYVKGWRRSVTALIVAQGVKELGVEPSELTQNYKAGQGVSA